MSDDKFQVAMEAINAASDVNDDFDLLDEKQAAKTIKLLPHTLTVWRCRKPSKAPPYIRLGRKIFYRRSDLRNWLAAQVVRPQEMGVREA